MMPTTIPDEIVTALEQADQDLDAGRVESAHEAFVRASEQDPNSARAWYGRSLTASDPYEALVSLGYSSALDPDDRERVIQLDKAANMSACCAERADAPALEWVGERFAEAGLVDSARPLLRRATELDETQAGALVWLAAVTREPAEAEQLLQRAIEIDSGHPIAQSGIAALHAGPGGQAAPSHAGEPVEELVTGTADLAEAQSEVENELPPEVEQPPSVESLVQLADEQLLPAPAETPGEPLPAWLREFEPVVREPEAKVSEPKPARKQLGQPEQRPVEASLEAGEPPETEQEPAEEQAPGEEKQEIEGMTTGANEPADAARETERPERIARGRQPLNVGPLITIGWVLIFLILVALGVLYVLHL